LPCAESDDNGYCVPGLVGNRGSDVLDGRFPNRARAGRRWHPAHQEVSFDGAGCFPMKPPEKAWSKLL